MSARFPADPALPEVLSAFGLTSSALLGSGGEATVCALDSQRVLRIHRPGPERAALERREPLARAWLEREELTELYQPTRRWIAAFWSFARDDATLFAWCRSVLAPRVNASAPGGGCPHAERAAPASAPRQTGPARQVTCHTPTVGLSRTPASATRLGPPAKGQARRRRPAAAREPRPALARTP